MRDLIERRMAARLKLDEAQRTKMHGILVDSQRQLHELRGEFAPRFTRIMTNSGGQISVILNEEQRARFEKFREENRELWSPREAP